MTTLSPTRRATRRARRASPQPSVRRVPGCSPAETRRPNARQQRDVAVDRKPLSTCARRIAAMTQHEQRGGAVGLSIRTTRSGLKRGPRAIALRESRRGHGSDAGQSGREGRGNGDQHRDTRVPVRGRGAVVAARRVGPTTAGSDGAGVIRYNIGVVAQLYDRPVAELMKEAAADISYPARPGDVVAWFAERYPEVKSTTVRAHVTGLTENDRSRHDYAGLARREPLFIRSRDGALMP